MIIIIYKKLDVVRNIIEMLFGICWFPIPYIYWKSVQGAELWNFDCLNVNNTIDIISS